MQHLEKSEVYLKKVIEDTKQIPSYEEYELLDSIYTCKVLLNSLIKECDDLTDLTIQEDIIPRLKEYKEIIQKFYDDFKKKNILQFYSKLYEQLSYLINKFDEEYTQEDINYKIKTFTYDFCKDHILNIDRPNEPGFSNMCLCHHHPEQVELTELLEEEVKKHIDLLKYGISKFY